MTAGALQRAVQRGAGRSGQAAQRCDLCSAPAAAAHSHVLDETRGEVLCACRACALLFERDAAARDHYRLIPDRRVRLTGVSPTSLGVPVGLAFFVPRSSGGVLAHYPSPVGATQWEVDPARWRAATQGCEPLNSMRPEVEALLINTVRGADEKWLVPIDDCHRLVAIVRREWKGLSGGRRVWAEIERFFAGLSTGEGGGPGPAG